MLGFLPPAFKIRQNPTWSFHAINGSQRESRLFDLGPQLVRMMKERVCKILRTASRISMLSIGQVASHNLGKLWVLQIPSTQAVKCGGKSRDADGQQRSAGPEYAMRLAQGLNPVGSVGQMIEWTEQDYCIRRFRTPLERSSIADFG